MNPLNRLRNIELLRKLRWFGWRFQCSACGSSLSQFLAHPSDPQQKNDALCPVCRSKNPHRRIALLLRELRRIRPDIRKSLHIAPEQHLGKRLRSLFGHDYVSGDIAPQRGQLQFDIAELPFEDNSFDLICCCHVLMMIPSANIPRAVSECFRVLKPGGVAIIENPVQPGHTVEMENATDEERRARWYSHDVLRILGELDYWPMFANQGFSRMRLDFSPASQQRYALFLPGIDYLQKPLSSVESA